MIRSPYFYFLFLFSTCIYSQKIPPENLSEKTKVFWDANKKFIHSSGSLYVDDRGTISTEKHGKWLFYSVKGVLEEERYYFRDRIHGKQTNYFPDKSIKQLTYYSFNVPDSSFKEWYSNKNLKTSGAFSLGSPIGNWSYYYEDGKTKSIDSIVVDTVYTISYWDNSKNHLQTITNGNGHISTYYSTGAIKEKYQFINGLKTGPFEERLANGRVSIDGEFDKGKKEGCWSFYGEEGFLDKKINYHLDSLHGEYIVYYTDGQINTAGNYLDGMKNGQWTWNLPENKGVEMKGAFENNLQEGAWEYYYSSGELSYLANYKKGLRSGEWSYFYKDSTLYRQGDFSNDLKEGKWKTWYEDGTLLMEGDYNLGKETGPWRVFWENGRIKNQSSFDAGRLDGAWLSFTPTGSKSLEGDYKSGQKTGLWKEFYNNGKIKEETNYKLKTIKNRNNDVVIMGMKTIQSVQHGKFKAYSQLDYEIKETGKYKNGIKTGAWINYHPGGVMPAVVSHYKKGKLHGVCMQYGRSGDIMNEIHYKNGLKDGLFLVYNANHKVVVKKMFRKGREMRQLAAGDAFTP